MDEELEIVPFPPPLPVPEKAVPFTVPLTLDDELVVKEPEPKEALE